MLFALARRIISVSPCFRAGLSKVQHRRRQRYRRWCWWWWTNEAASGPAQIYASRDVWTGAMPVTRSFGVNVVTKVGWHMYRMPIRPDDYSSLRVYGRPGSRFGARPRQGAFWIRSVASRFLFNMSDLFAKAVPKNL